MRICFPGFVVRRRRRAAATWSSAFPHARHGLVRDEYHFAAVHSTFPPRRRTPFSRVDSVQPADSFLAPFCLLACAPTSCGARRSVVSDNCVIHLWAKTVLLRSSIHSLHSKIACMHTLCVDFFRYSPIRCVRNRMRTCKLTSPVVRRSIASDGVCAYCFCAV